MINPYEHGNGKLIPNKFPPIYQRAKHEANNAQEYTSTHKVHK